MQQEEEEKVEEKEEKEKEEEAGTECYRSHSCNTIGEGLWRRSVIPLEERSGENDSFVRRLSCG